MSDDDPFEDLDEAVEDREGDPFESLGEATEGPHGSEGGNDGQAASDNDGQRRAAFDGEQWQQPGSEADTDGTADLWPDADSTPTATADATPQEATGEEQLPRDEETTEPENRSGGSSEEPSKMSFGIGRRESEGKPGGPSLEAPDAREGDPFERVQGAFEEMDTGEVDPDAVWQSLASAESRGSVGNARERTYAEVSKHSYCEGCEHFSEPPEIKCTHEGTDIMEFLDMETVRVVDCPIVAEREELEES